MICTQRSSPEHEGAYEYVGEVWPLLGVFLDEKALYTEVLPFWSVQVL